MAASITILLQIFKRPKLLRFSTDLDETDIKIHGLLRSLINTIVSIGVAVPFKRKLLWHGLTLWGSNCRKVMVSLNIQSINGGC